MAKYQLTKQPGGVFTPANDIEVERLQRLKSGYTFEVEIKQSRNQKFHGQAFAFLTFCYEHYFNEGVNGNKEKFDWMRKEITKAAGFYVEIETRKGAIREAKSLSFAEMDQESFSEWYNAAIQVSMLTIFKGCDQSTIDRLYSFF